TPNRITGSEKGCASPSIVRPSAPVMSDKAKACPSSLAQDRPRFAAWVGAIAKPPARALKGPHAPLRAQGRIPRRPLRGLAAPERAALRAGGGRSGAGAARTGRALRRRRGPDRRGRPCHGPGRALRPREGLGALPPDGGAELAPEARARRHPRRRAGPAGLP